MKRIAISALCADMVESLGVETLVYARLPGNVQIVARGSERSRLHPDDRTRVSFDAGHLHHFEHFGKTYAAAATGAISWT